VELSFVEGECRSGEVLKALVWIRPGWRRSSCCRCTSC